MDFVSIDTWTIIFTWINLLILVLIMKKLLFKPIMNMLAQREEEVNSMYKQAEEAQQNAENLEKDYTQKLSVAKEEAARIMKDTVREATLKGEEIVSDAQNKAAAVLSKAHKEIERERLSAVNEIKSDIASIAVSVAEKVIEKDINESDYERLVEEFINGSGEEK
ncbi:MAG: F0F1 ATP synthase subunit B [Clostridia bacterium]|nr:F0F1 ATP synthase subunit B [Clostridia bacterium]